MSYQNVLLDVPLISDNTNPTSTGLFYYLGKFSYSSVVNIEFSANIKNNSNQSFLSQNITFELLPSYTVLTQQLSFISNSNNTAIISGTITENSNIEKNIEFIIRATLTTAFSDNTRSVTVSDHYFFYTYSNLYPSIYWNNDWLLGLTNSIINNQTVYNLGTFSFGSYIVCPTYIVSNTLPVTYTIESISIANLSPVLSTLPKGLGIDDTGRITGYASISNLSDIYYFKISVSDGVNNGSPQTDSIIFSIVLSNGIVSSSNVGGNVIWTTPAGNIGSIEENTPCYFSIVASTPGNESITYSLTNTSDPLPTGLVLQSTGLLQGRAPLVNVDTTYNFSAMATSPTDTNTRNFSFVVKSLNLGTDFLNFYSLVTGELKKNISILVRDTSTVLPNLIFRSNDPYYGIISHPALFIAGGIKNYSGCIDTSGNIVNCASLNSVSLLKDKLQDYEYQFYLNITSINYSTLYDSNNNAISDVIFLQLVDPQQNSGGFLNGVEQNITSNQKRIWPVSINNIRNDILQDQNRNNNQSLVKSSQGFGLIGSEPLPIYMDSFSLVLPIVYVKPGVGSSIVDSIIQSSDYSLIKNKIFPVNNLMIYNPQYSLNVNNLAFDSDNLSVYDIEEQTNQLLLLPVK